MCQSAAGVALVSRLLLWCIIIFVCKWNLRHTDATVDSPCGFMCEEISIVHNVCVSACEMPDAWPWKIVNRLNDAVFSGSWFSSLPKEFSDGRKLLVPKPGLFEALSSVSDAESGCFHMQTSESSKEITIKAAVSANINNNRDVPGRVCE